MKDTKIHKTNGQLWIDKNSPFRLKYKVNDEIFSVDVSSEYIITTPMYTGQVVSFSHVSTGETTSVSGKLAIFPDDIENVIGVVGQTVNIDDEVKTTPILKSGIIELTQKDIECSFIDLDDYVNTAEADDSYYVGAPVYWFIGKINRTGEGTSQNPYVYSYIDSSEYPGRLTLKTPSGNKWRLNDNTLDSSLNVGYDNLPTVGNVISYKVEDVYHIYDVPEEKIGTKIEGEYYVYSDNEYTLAYPIYLENDTYYIKQGATFEVFTDYTPGERIVRNDLYFKRNSNIVSVYAEFYEGVIYYTKNKQFTSIKIHLNVNKFDSSLEWNWPYMYSNGGGTITPGSDNKAEIIIRHGLFAFDEKDNNTITKMILRPRNYCDIVALSNTNDDEFVVNAGIENYYGQNELEPGSKDRRTEIYLSTPETFRYRISGRVNYKFDKKQGEN